MPDWSYRTVFQPLLLRLPVALARSIALGGIGTLAKLPGGGRVIDFMGHMAPDAALGFEKGGLRFPSRVGLGLLIDPTGSALAAMARFGFGCIEVGPLEIEAALDRLEGTFDIPQRRVVSSAVALFTAGVVILGVGSTSVFVTEDLEFMNTTAATLTQANPRIIPLIAHDRASFGGMLLSSGVATLLPVLWGFERGRPWVWRMLAGAGVAGYLCAISVHFAVGYVSAWHLAPAFGGALVLAVGLLLSRSYLCERPD